MKAGLLFFFSLLLFLPQTLLAQVHQPDTSFVHHSVANAVQAYKEKVGLQALLYTGDEYFIVTKPYLEGHPFFEVKSMENGAILYDGAWFDEVPMLYDVVRDEVIIFHPGNSYSQKLVKQKVDSFILRGHTFVRLDADSTAGSSISPGFYDVLYDGEVKVFARREKDVQDRVANQGREGSHDIADKFYLWKDGAYHQVRSKRSVLNVLSDEKKQLKKFASANKLKFKQQRESSILKLAQHYDKLKN